MTASPSVSIVVLNYNGGEDTTCCLESLAELRPPSGGFEVIVVDNGSQDGSADRIQELIAGSDLDAKLIRNQTNTGFTGGCNRGVLESRGRYVALLNNDARPDPDWLAAAVEELERSPALGCVASKVLSWEGDRVDFGGGCGVTFYGYGYREGFGERAADHPDIDNPRDVLFATGSAAVFRRAAWDDAGGFDDRYFAFFEDVDLGWRLWLLGWRVRYIPASVVFHRHHGTMRKFGQWWEDYLLERNALFTLIKNFDDARLSRCLGAALLLGGERARRADGFDAHALDLATAAPSADEPPTLDVSRSGAAPLLAIASVSEAWPELVKDRVELQSRRVRPDGEILPLIAHPMLPNRGGADYRAVFDSMVTTLGIEEQFAPRRRIAIVTGDPLRPAMSGPGIRALEIARVLSAENEVRLLSTGTVDLTGESFPIIHADHAALVATERWCDALVFQGFLLDSFPWLARTKKALVVDLYDPFHLEQLEQTRGDEPFDRLRRTRHTTQVINDQLGRGDFFMCASEKQRDFWLGQLAGVGRVSPANYDDDPTLRTLIDVVPFGLGTPPPPPRGHVLKGVHPAIGLDDRVVIWGGGLYSWFDSHTVVRAMAQLRTSRPDLRLFFMGGRHPNPDVPEMPITRTTRSLAQELGLADKSIVFNDSWIDYDQRHRWLADSDVGVSAHLDHVETEFSFRTRILDYIWAGLPIVCTSGDSLGRLVASRQLGITVPPGDVVAMADALDRASADDDLRATAAANLAQLAEEMQWDRMLEPLLEWVRRPRHAADLVERFGPIEIHTPSTLGAMVKRGSDLARRGLGVARREGVGVAARRTAEVARRRLQG